MSVCTYCAGQKYVPTGHVMDVDPCPRCGATGIEPTPVTQSVITLGTITTLDGVLPVPALRSELQWFANEMEGKLRENDHKGHWRDCSLEYLRTRMHEEFGELLTALDRVPAASPDEIAREAADVANFAMMIADVCRMRMP